MTTSNQTNSGAAAIRDQLGEIDKEYEALVRNRRIEHKSAK